MTQRFSLTLLALIFIIILPWWLNVFILLALVFLFPWYYEAIILIFIYELIYGSGLFLLTIAGLVLVPLAEELKKRLYVFS